MTKRVNDHQSNRRYDCEESRRMLFTDFKIIVLQNVTESSYAQEDIKRAYDVISSQGNIGSDEHDYLLVSLRRMNAIVCDFQRLFEEPTMLPLVVTHIYCPLAAELCSVETLIKRAIHLAGSICSTGRIVLNISVKQQYAVICLLEEISEACEIIRMHSQILLDQARFQARCLI